MTMTFNRIIGWSVAMVAALCAVDPASAGCWGTIRTCPDVNADQARGGKKRREHSRRFRWRLVCQII